jgi:hypothetical protein
MKDNMDLYIDFAIPIQTKWRDGDDAAGVVKRLFDCESATFIVNPLAKISENDLYRIVLKTDDCPEFFILRHSLKLIPKEIVYKYLLTQFRQGSTYDPLKFMPCSTSGEVTSPSS